MDTLHEVIDVKINLIDNLCYVVQDCVLCCKYEDAGLKFK